MVHQPAYTRQPMHTMQTVVNWRRSVKSHSGPLLPCLLDPISAYRGAAGPSSHTSAVIGPSRPTPWIVVARVAPNDLLNGSAPHGTTRQRMHTAGRKSTSFFVQKSMVRQQGTVFCGSISLEVFHLRRQFSEAKESALANIRSLSTRQPRSGPQNLLRLCSRFTTRSFTPPETYAPILSGCSASQP